MWLGVVGIILLAGLAYPLLATRTRLETRFAICRNARRLAYLETEPTIPKTRTTGTRDHVAHGDDLPSDRVDPRQRRAAPPTVRVGGGPYDWNARIAIHTGLPTVIGWDWHQKQQRWAFQSMIDERVADVQSFFTDARTRSRPRSSRPTTWPT